MLQSATMYDIASWLRAQVPLSTDPDRLERLAREAERQAALQSNIATIVKKRTPSSGCPGTTLRVWKARSSQQRQRLEDTKSQRLARCPAR